MAPWCCFEPGAALSWFSSPGAPSPAKVSAHRQVDHPSLSRMSTRCTWRTARVSRRLVANGRHGIGCLAMTSNPLATGLALTPSGHLPVDTRPP